MRVEFLGCAPVERLLVVRGPTTLRVVPEPLAGSYVTAAVEAGFWQVEARPADGGEPWRALLWRDARTAITHAPVPGETRAFLPPGRYDFRLRSDEHPEATLGPVDVPDTGEELELAFELRAGAEVRGRVLMADGAGLGGGLLHVSRAGPEGWERLPAKDAVVRKEEDSAYRVRGLGPGRYRLSLDGEGRRVLKDFELPPGRGGPPADLELDLVVD